MRLKKIIVFVFVVLTNVACSKKNENVENFRKDSSIIQTKVDTSANKVIVKLNEPESPDDILRKLDSVYNTSSLLQNKDVFYLSKADNLLTIGSFQLPVETITTMYDDKDRNDGFGPFHVELRCLSQSNCIYNVNQSNYLIALVTPFRSKEDCFTFIKIFDDLKLALRKGQ